MRGYQRRSCASHCDARGLLVVASFCAIVVASGAEWTRSLLEKPELIAFADPYVGKACRQSNDGVFNDVPSLTKCQRLCCSSNDPGGCEKPNSDTVYGCAAFIYDKPNSRCKVYKKCTLKDTDTTEFDYWLYKWWSAGELDDWAPEPELNGLSYKDLVITPEFLTGYNNRVFKLYSYSKCETAPSVPFGGADPVVSTQQCSQLCQEELGWKCKGFHYDSQFGRCQFYSADYPCHLRVASQLDYTYLS